MKWRKIPEEFAKRGAGEELFPDSDVTYEEDIGEADEIQPLRMVSCSLQSLEQFQEEPVQEISLCFIL